MSVFSDYLSEARISWSFRLTHRSASLRKVWEETVLIISSQELFRLSVPEVQTELGKGGI